MCLTRSSSANQTAMINGGGPSMVYGFIFAVFGSLTTAASLAEMASMAPTSGGQYHWVSMLAPEKYKVFLSWITGMTYTFSFFPFLTSISGLDSDHTFRLGRNYRMER